MLNLTKLWGTCWQENAVAVLLEVLPATDQCWCGCLESSDWAQEPVGGAVRRSGGAEGDCNLNGRTT